MKQQKRSYAKAQPINESIRFPKMQVITADGINAGILTKREALALAEGSHLDLVLISEQGGHGFPVAKIMDFGKVLYEKKKKAAESKRHQKKIQVKEIKIRPKIGSHDLETKMKRAVEFLNEGKYVKVTLAFRGRERDTKFERGAEMFEQVESIFSDNGLSNLSYEKESRMGPIWSRTYYVKTKK